MRSTMDDQVASTPDARRSYSVGYDYDLSKRTDLYAAHYRDKQLNPLTQQTILALGIRHRF